MQTIVLTMHAQTYAYMHTVCLKCTKFTVRNHHGILKVPPNQVGFLTSVASFALLPWRSLHNAFKQNHAKTHTGMWSLETK